MSHGLWLLVVKTDSRNAQLHLPWMRKPGSLGLLALFGCNRPSAIGLYSPDPLEMHILGAVGRCQHLSYTNLPALVSLGVPAGALLLCTVQRHSKVHVQGSSAERGMVW